MSASSLRNEMPQDHEAVRLLHTLAFGGPAPAKLAEDLRKSGDAVISVVALDDQKRIIGHIMLSRLKGPTKALMLAPFAVHPDFQARGVGSSLLRKSLDRARQDGWAVVFVLGDKGYYEHLGFPVKKGKASPQAGEHYLVLLPEADKTSLAEQIVVPPSFSMLK